MEVLLEALLLPNPYIHTTKKQCLPPFYNRQLPHFHKKILTLPPSMSFQKSQPPINRGLHTINILYTEVFSGIFFARTVKLLIKKQSG